MKKLFPLLMGLFLLAACEKSPQKIVENIFQSENLVEAANFPKSYANDAPYLEGETLEVAVVSDTNFTGLFQPEFYTSSLDNQFMQPSHESLFLSDQDFKVTTGGVADLSLDPESNRATIKLKDQVYWNDGTQLTVDDLIFSYEVMGHKDYTGVRYDDNLTNIVGMEDYHTGLSEEISGLDKIDSLTLEISYKEMGPSFQQVGGGVWRSALPKHVLENIPIKEMENALGVTSHVVSFGPYYMSEIIPGEKVTYLPNPYYWGEKPHLGKITLEIISHSEAIKAMEKADYDLFLNMPTDIYSHYDTASSYEFLARESKAYSYIGFKLGYWDEEKNQAVLNPESKMNNVSLRQAIGYAVDNDEIGYRFYNGLRYHGNTLIPHIFTRFNDTSLVGFTYNLEKAKTLLKDAGYQDLDDDGYLEDPSGEQLIIYYGAIAGGSASQATTEYYLSQWKSIGLNVKLYGGKLWDRTQFYELLGNDVESLDMYQAGWGTGNVPSPTSLWGKHSFFNYTRFVSEENDRLLQAIDAKESFNEETRLKNFSAWQEYALKEAFAIPTLFRDEILPVHERVKGVDWCYGAKNMWGTIGVTKKDRKLD